MTEGNRTAWVSTMVLALMGFWIMRMVSGATPNESYRAQVSAGAGVAQFDVTRHTYVVPSTAELALLQADATGLKGLRSDARLREEQAPSEAGGVRVRLGTRFQSTMRIAIGEDNANVTCAETEETEPESEGGGDG